MKTGQVLLILLICTIIGLAYPSLSYGIDFRLRPFIGYGILLTYMIVAGILIYELSIGTSGIAKQVFIRLGVIGVAALICLGTYQWFLSNNDKLGGGYLLYFLLIGFGTLFSIYAIIETGIFFARKKTEKALANLIIAEGIFYFFIFSNLFGY